MAVVLSMFQDASVGNDPKALSINIVQLGGFMVPMLVGSSLLVLTASDKETGMLARIQTFGLSAKEIGLSKSLWATLVAFTGIAGVVLATFLAGSSFGVQMGGNYIAIVSFGLVAEVLCLVPAFLNLALRQHGQAFVLALSLVGALLGSAGHFIPRAVAAWIPFTFVGAVSPVRVNGDGFFESSYSALVPLVVLITSVLIGLISIASFPRRMTND
ncbi:hypothetical protein [Corynebacterium camporealensis]|uniref:hypothetical protein n=1 Tax=Corynebacterium camporealensis TaxID=161896 RepID=UPI001B80218B|nr:hypothetical protein [Corynebacterium camporealensis]